MHPDKRAGELLDELARLEKAALPAPWDVWAEPTPTRDEAVAELTGQVMSTDPFAGAVYLLNAGGKCPATTGCGPTSEVHASLIVAMRNHLPELIALAREGLEGRWQPIETAPHNRWIECYRPESDVGHWDRFVVARWCGDDGDFIWTEGVFDIVAGDLDDLIESEEYYSSGGTFTHWREIRRPVSPTPEAGNHD